MDFIPKIKNFITCNLKNSSNDETEHQYLQSDFYKLLKKNKKSKYDCLLMCSGGKDSVSSLYLIKEKYGLNPLVFTFDNGFETKEALENIKNATKKLEVDFLFYKNTQITQIYKILLSNQDKFKAPICHICSIWYMKLTYEMAKRYDIDIIIAGWTKGQISMGKCCESKNFDVMLADTISAIKYLRTQGYDLPYTSQSLKKQYSNIQVLSPHWFEDYNEEDLKDFLRKEYNWKEQPHSYPKGSTNCLMNYASVYLSMKNYGFTHYHIEYNMLIKKGEITRKEADANLKINFDKKFVNNIIKKIGCKIK